MPAQIYIAKFDSSANLLYGTYLGGSGSSAASGIDVDSSGNISIIGQTDSADFPITTGSRPTQGSPFLTRINADASGVLSSTILGVTSVSALGVAPDGSTYLTGTVAAPPFEPCHPGALPFPCPFPLFSLFLSRLLPSGAIDWTTNLFTGSS
jgi:hypothetical protein